MPRSETASTDKTSARSVDGFPEAAAPATGSSRSWRHSIGGKLLIALGLIAALTIIYSNVPKDTTRDALRILGNLAFFFYVINAIRSFSLAKAVVVVWLLASIGTGIYAVYDYYVGQSVQVEEA